MHISFFLIYFFYAGFGEKVIVHPLFRISPENNKAYLGAAVLLHMQHIWPTALETKWNIRIYRKTKFHIPHARQNQLSAISTAEVTD